MKAPDKIYLSVRKGEDWAYAMWTQKTPEEQKFSELDEHEEYIRKDALIEWINKMLQDTADRLDFRGNQAFAQLLDKLNSM